MYFKVSGPRPVTVVETRLVGDGVPFVGWQMQDARYVAGVYFLASKAGRWWIQVRVTDELGCQDTTANQRSVIVR